MVYGISGGALTDCRGIVFHKNANYGRQEKLTRLSDAKSTGTGT